MTFIIFRVFPIAKQTAVGQVQQAVLNHVQSCKNVITVLQNQWTDLYKVIDTVIKVVVAIQCTVDANSI